MSSDYQPRSRTKNTEAKLMVKSKEGLADR